MPFPRLTRLLPSFGRTPLTAPQLIFHTVAAGLLYHVVAAHTFTIRFTYGASMVPTLQTIGDAVVISRAHRRGRGIAVGDLVNYENPFRLDYGVIKRVVGMPGDFVLRDTPGAEGEGLMVQVGASLGSAGPLCADVEDRCLRATAGSPATIRRIRGIRGSMARCRWLWSRARSLRACCRLGR